MAEPTWQEFFDWLGDKSQDDPCKMYGTVSFLATYTSNVLGKMPPPVVEVQHRTSDDVSGECHMLWRNCCYTINYIVYRDGIFEWYMRDNKTGYFVGGEDADITTGIPGVHHHLVELGKHSC